MTMHFSAVVTEVGKVASLYSQTQQIVLSIGLSKNILSNYTSYNFHLERRKKNEGRYASSWFTQVIKHLG